MQGKAAPHLCPLPEERCGSGKIHDKERRFVTAVLHWCARQGALTWGLESPARPTRGSASRTARATAARRSLKEAAGKMLP
jgi:hypothetical protein